MVPRSFPVSCFLFPFLLVATTTFCVFCLAAVEFVDLAYVFEVATMSFLPVSWTQFLQRAQKRLHTRAKHFNYLNYKYTRHMHAALTRIWKLKFRNRFDLVNRSAPNGLILHNSKCSVPMIPNAHLRVVCISDTHELHQQMDIPSGDILIHAGDILMSDALRHFEHTLDASIALDSQMEDESAVISGESMAAIADFNQWLGALPHAIKIVTGGNHDFALRKMGSAKAKELLTNATYVVNDSLSISKHSFSEAHFCGRQMPDFEIKAWVSPYSTANSLWSPNKAFQEFAKDHIGDAVWNRIPKDVNLLITHMHTAPSVAENMDVKSDEKLGRGKTQQIRGCKHLRRRVDEHCHELVLHVFGHWHALHGVFFDGKKTFINASNINSGFIHMFPPIVFDYPIP